MTVEAFMNYLAEAFDLPILDWIAAKLTCPVLDAVMPVITALGDAGIFWIALAVLFLLILISIGIKYLLNKREDEEA